MKRQLFLSLLVVFTLGIFPTDAQTKKATSDTKIEVYYFHSTRRCITCNAVESVTKDAIAQLYPTQMKSGQITFKSINLDEKGNEAILKKCKTEGQSLLFLAKNKRIDLTDKAFMYAKNSPNKLKAEVKKTVDSLL